MLEPLTFGGVQHYMDVAYLYRSVLALCLSLGLSTCCVAQEQYFPPKTFGTGQWAEAEADLYSYLLKKLEEPPLFRKVENPSNESYRFLWLRTFHNPVAVRMEVQPDGTSLLTIKVADGEAGFPRTVKKLIQNSTRPLSREQTEAFRKKVTTEGFWKAASRDKGKAAATDCDGWILEGLRSGDYHVVERAIPNTLPKNTQVVQSLGLTLAIELGQMDIPENER
jgi:hypothetical protein